MVNLRGATRPKSDLRSIKKNMKNEKEIKRVGIGMREMHSLHDPHACLTIMLLAGEPENVSRDAGEAVPAAAATGGKAMKGSCPFRLLSVVQMPLVHVRSCDCAGQGGSSEPREQGGLEPEPGVQQS